MKQHLASLRQESKEENEGRTARENAVKQIVQSASNDPPDTLLDKTVAALHSNFPHYTGVYLYLLKSDTLVLGPYRGRQSEHTHIPVGAGVCGRAARDKTTVTVDDVNADPEYLACSLETRSEIVVPIMRGDDVLGEIDIDSDTPAAFSQPDRRFLEQVAQQLAPRLAEQAAGSMQMAVSSKQKAAGSKH